MSYLWLLALPAAWVSWRYAWWRRPVELRYPRILMYHMIAPHKPGARFNGLRVPPDMFERQLRWLNARGWKSLFISELIEQGERVPPGCFAITFDDGYADNLTAALPLLKKYACKATLYLVVDRFDRDWSVLRKAHHDEAELQREEKLTDAQVELMLASGCVELGSHSLTHANMAQLGDADVEQELLESRRQLEARFAVSIKTFAWPFGLCTQQQAALPGRAGYASAVTTDEGIEDPGTRDPLQLKRIKISGRDNFMAFRLRMRTGRRGYR